ncbi:MAG: hypothetical protein QXO15_04610 [Nitrososphaerota archaeon]
MEIGTFVKEAIPCPFASFLCWIEIDILDKLYPMDGHPVFDLIGLKAEPEESYNLTIDLRACYQYVNRLKMCVGEGVTTFKMMHELKDTRRRHELGRQYQNALRKLIQEVEEKLGSSISIIDKAVIELKSSAKENITLTSKQKTLIPELIERGFKIYVLSAQYCSDWKVRFTLHELSNI